MHLPEKALIQLPDGSYTLSDPETGELYHNAVGAITEAFCHYVQPSDVKGLLQNKSHVVIADICFGLGYNTWMWLAEACRIAQETPNLQTGSITVLAIDGDFSLTRFYPRILADPTFSSFESFLTPSEHNIDYQTQDGEIQNYHQNRIEILKGHFLTPKGSSITVSVELLCVDLRAWLVAEGLPAAVDLIFHDPFSPRRVCELWTLEIFQRYFRALTPCNGRVLTYSSANAVRAALRDSGFVIYQTPPLGRKHRGGLCGIAGSQLADPDGGLTPLDKEGQGILSGAAWVPYRDPSGCADRVEIQENRRLEQQQYG